MLNVILRKETLHGWKRCVQKSFAKVIIFFVTTKKMTTFLIFLPFYFFRGTSTLNVEPSPTTDSTIQLPPILRAKS